MKINLIQANEVEQQLRMLKNKRKSRNKNLRTETPSPTPGALGFKETLTPEPDDPISLSSHERSLSIHFN